MDKNEKMIRALKTRREFRQHRATNPSEDTPERYAGFVASMMSADNKGEEFDHWYENALEELQYGQELFDQGYRIHFGTRKHSDLYFAVPEDAVAAMTWPAGHIAGTEAARLIWVTRHDKEPGGEEE